jgi:hypothetical protein
MGIIQPQKYDFDPVKQPYPSSIYFVCGVKLFKLILSNQNK